MAQSEADQIQARVRAAVEDGGILASLADRVGASVGARAVFGEAVERDGVTVIPVAKAWWGFGAGEGGEPPNAGSGGGGGGMTRPIGFIELRDGGAEFRRLRDLRAVAVPAAALAGLAGVLLGRRAGRS